MAYNKNSGESRLQKKANPDAYINKTNKKIFQTQQTTRATPKPQHKKNDDWEIPDSSEYERRRRNETESKKELLSFVDIIKIIAVNALIPVIGGFIFYIILSTRGNRRKAAQSIVLSAIVSIIRIAYIVNI
jgi:hypothetical protein